MRFVSLLIICACLFLAACGGAAPTATQTAPPTESVDANSTPSELGIIAQTIAVPPPGQLSYIDTSGTPGVRQPLQFDQVQLEILPSGGGSSTVITVYRDGRVTRDDQEVQVGADTIEALRGLLDQINFYNIQGMFVGEGGTTQGNRYFLTVNGPNGSRLITLDERFTPTELLAIITLIQSLGESMSAEPTPGA